MLLSATYDLFMARDVRAELFLLDRKIYSKVFGGKLLTPAEMKKEAGKLMARRPEGSYWFPRGFYAKKSQTGHVTYHQDIPRYSTDIKDAFMIVRFMREHGFIFDLSQPAGGGDGAAQAICKAALKTLEA